MKKPVPKAIPTCPVDYAFQRIGGKYKGRILSALGFGILRYGELKKSIPDITPKMLTQALRELEDDDLITRKVYLEVPPRVEYELSEYGRDFLPAIRVIAEWGIKQMNLRQLPILERRQTKYA